jgi:hypothetical protein
MTMVLNDKGNISFPEVPLLRRTAERIYCPLSFIFIADQSPCSLLAASQCVFPAAKGKKLQEISLKSTRSSGSISAVPTRAQFLLKKLPPADCFSFVSLSAGIFQLHEMQ